jgi:hypothetical protein
MLPGLCKLGCASNSAKPFFGSLSGARRRDHGEKTGAACAATIYGVIDSWPFGPNLVAGPFLQTSME